MMKIETDKLLSQLGNLNDEQFKVLFFIYNSINMNSDKTNRVKIYRAVLADLTGKSERTISRITDKLVKQGLITKDNVSDGSKLYNYYGLPSMTKSNQKVDNEKQKTKPFLVTDDRVKEHERTLNEIKENKKIYDISCNILEDSSKKQIDIQDKEYNEWIEDNLKYNVIENDIMYFE